MFEKNKKFFFLLNFVMHPAAEKPLCFISGEKKPKRKREQREKKKRKEKDEKKEKKEKKIRKR